MERRIKGVLSPKASGSITITENGNYDVVDVANAVVEVKPSGAIEITENGEHDVSDYATANVNVKDWFKWFIEIRGGYHFLFGNSSMTQNTLLTDSRDIIKYEDTSNYTDFRYMYYSCRKLVHINCHDTRNATTIEYMLNTCDSLEDDLTFDLQNCTKANGAFQQAKKVKKIILKNTSKMQSFYGTFQSCENLEYLSQLDLTSCTDISWGFRDAKKLKYLDLKNYNFSTEGATNQAFSGIGTRYLIIRSFLDNYILGSNSKMPYNMKILVPREWIETLKSATNWSSHGDYIFAIEDYTIDGTTTGELDESQLV